MRHILEYEDHDVRNLLKDLEGVGHADKAKASIWIEIVTKDDYLDCQNVITTEPFYATGDPDRDGETVLQMIVDGEFEYAPLDLYETKGFPKEEVQEIAKDYLEGKDAYKKIYLRQGKSGNALDAFANDFAIESLNLIAEENLTFVAEKANFKVYIAPPENSVHQKDKFYTIPNPVNVVEYIK